MSSSSWVQQTDALIKKESCLWAKMSDWTNQVPPLKDVAPAAVEGGWEVWVEEQQGVWAAYWLLRGHMEANSVRTNFPAVGPRRISKAQARARALGEMRRRNGPGMPPEATGSETRDPTETPTAGGQLQEAQDKTDLVGPWLRPPPREPNPVL